MELTRARTAATLVQDSSLHCIQIQYVLQTGPDLITHTYARAPSLFIFLAVS
jgi:hypothetical protein